MKAYYDFQISILISINSFEFIFRNMYIYSYDILIKNIFYYLKTIVQLKKNTVCMYYSPRQVVNKAWKQLLHFFCILQWFIIVVNWCSIKHYHSEILFLAPPTLLCVSLSVWHYTFMFKSISSTWTINFFYTTYAHPIA